MVRLGIDFGESETVLVIAGTAGGADDGIVISAQNLVHLDGNGTLRFGNEVVESGISDAASTIRHMRHFVLKNSPLLIREGSYAIPYRDAAGKFLKNLIRNAMAVTEKTVDEAVFSAPAGATPEYRAWLASVAEETKIHSVRIVDDAVLAVAGYSLPLNMIGYILIIDVGGGRTEVTVASSGHALNSGDESIRIIGRAASDTGVDAIDGWMAAEVLRRTTPVWIRDPVVDRHRLIAACRAAREGISSSGTAASIPVPDGRMCGSITVSREEFTHLLERHNLPGITNRTIDRALAAAQLKEDNGDTVSLVLMIGQANRIPGFLEIVRTRFSPGRVLCEKPEHVVARGAARLGPGCVSRPRITRDYALRYYDPKACGHQYRYIVRAGTEYPTERETARVLISAAYDGQTRLGIALYSLSGNGHEPVQQGIELVADPQGATRRHERPAASQGMDAVRINRLSPTFLVATPPGNCGQVRFELAFSIDRTGQLRLSARDVMTGRHILENHSCAQLT